jgi:hypothetical protein
MQQKVQHLQDVTILIEESRNSFKHQLIKTTSYCEKLIKDQEKLSIEKINLLNILEQREREKEDSQNFGCNIAHKIETIKNHLKVYIF